MNDADGIERHQKRSKKSFLRITLSILNPETIESRTKKLEF